MKKFFATLLASILGTFIALGLCSILFMGMIGSMLAFTQTPPTTVPDSAILEINLKTSIGEQTTEETLDISSLLPTNLISTSQDKLGILEAVKAIRIAAKDPAIKMVNIVNTEMGGSISIAKAEELRDALEYFHESGKPVVAYATNFSQVGYYLASVADKIYTHSMSTNELIGLSSKIFFLKDILDKVGVNVQLIRHGKYKSAGEQFIANDISKANREQNEAMLTALWNEMASSICKSRNITEDKFNSLINNLEIGTADKLLANGLIDGILTMDEMNKKLCELFEVEDEKDLVSINLDKYAKAKVKENYEVKDKIAIIYADGEIVDGKGTEKIAGLRFASLIKKAREDKNIKGVVLRVNSPGGSAQAAEIIRNELRLLNAEKPVVASYGDYAASGGYWISAECDKIFTNNTTLTGSIGVFSMIPEFGSVIRKKLYVNPVSINTHKHADMLSLMRPFDKAETDFMQGTVEVVYDQFLKVVSEGRKMTEKDVDEIAQGRVWAGSEALVNHLADAKGGLYEAIEYTAKLCELEEYRTIAFPTVQSSMEKLMSSFNQAKVNIDLLSDPTALYNATIKSIKESNGIYARLPYIYEFN